MELLALVQQLRAAGVPEGQIPAVIQQLAAEAERRKQRALRSGYTPEYLSSLSGPQLFGLDDTVSLLGGQTEVSREQQGLQDAAAVQEARARTGLSLLEFIRARANDLYEMQGNPHDTVKYLAALAELPQGTGNPVQALTNQGFRIEPSIPSGYADERFERLLDSFYDFGRPRTVEENIAETQRGQEAAARAQYGDDTISRLQQARSQAGDQQFLEAMRRYAEFDRARGMASGGTMVATEPIVGLGAFSGEPHFTMAENGPEMLQVTPMPGVSQQLDPRRQQAMVQAATMQGVPARTPLGQFAGMADGGTVAAVPKYARSQALGMFAMYPQKFGARVGMPNYDVRLDINDDGIVNSTDVFLVGGSQSYTPFRGRIPGLQGDFPVTQRGGVEPAPTTPPVDFPMPRRTPRRAAGRDFTPLRRFSLPRRPIRGLASGGQYYGFNSPGEAMKFADSIKGASTAQLSALSRMAGGGLGRFQRGGQPMTPVSHRGDDYLRSQYNFSDEFMTDPRFEGFRRQIATYGPAGTNPFFSAADKQAYGAFLGYDEYGNEIYEGGTRPSQHNRGPNAPLERPDGGEYQATRYRGPRFSGNANLPPSSGGGGGTGTPASPATQDPAQAAAMALGNALERNPFAHPDMVAALKQGKPPPPGTVTQRFLSSAPPSLVATLDSVMRGFGYTTEDWQDAVQQFAIPSFRAFSVQR